MPWKKRPSKPNLLIVQTAYIIKKDAMQKLHDRLVKEIKTGVVCLPAGTRAKIISGNLKVQIEDDKSMRNELMTFNEIRQAIGMGTLNDPELYELRNSNLSAPSEEGYKNNSEEVNNEQNKT